MGVSIMLGRGHHWTNISPGWRSMMVSLMQDTFGAHNPLYFTERNIPTLQMLAERQRKGHREPPFDWSDEIEDSFNDIIREIRREGDAIVRLDY